MQDFKSYLPQLVIIRNALQPFNKWHKALDKPLTNGVFKEALYVASPGFYDEINKVVQTTNVLDNKLQKSVTKYHIRSCTRCTPYGLFAGLHTATINENDTQIIIKTEPIAKLRLDMDYLVNVYHDLFKDDALTKELIYFPNTSLYRVASKWRYHEFRNLNKRIVFHLVTIDDNIVLSKLIKVAKDGIPYVECINVIKSYGFDEFEAKQYLSELIQSQVLVSELYPNVSGAEYQTVLFDKLSAFEPYKKLPTEVNSILLSKDSTITKTEQIKKVLSRYFKTAINESRFIQVDTLKLATHSNLNQEIAKQILEAAEVLNRLTSFDESQNVLTKFKRAFYERYETAELPLLEVLDTDIGINYKNAVSETEYRSSNKNNMLWDVLAKFKFDLYLKAQKNNLKEIAITNEDVKQFTAPNHKLPDTMAFMGELLQEKDTTKIVWGGISNNATMLPGRFGHLDESINKLCVEIAQKEEALQPNKIFAEIVHISEGRLGNILTRPHYRKYEIPYIAMSTLPIENQIQVSDLMVSVKNDRVILYSNRLNKEILPRMANAHNYAAMGLPIYHFLCDLQHQGFKGYLGWNWGFLGDEPFLPRISYKNVILCPAYWNIKTTKLKELTKVPIQQRLNKFIELKQEYNLPEKAYLSEGDNELLLDFNNKICLDIFFDAAKKHNQLKLTECLFTESNLIVKDEKGDGYTNEIIVPFVRKDVVVEDTKKISTLNASKITKVAKRTFEPYSEWVYFKIYAGTKTADKIIVKEIGRLTQTLKKKGVIDKWFFIRYSDPKNHLRIRFHLTNNNQFNTLNNLLQKELSQLVNNGLIWKIQTDTYQRELERYGFGSIELSEDFFHINSETTVALLKLLDSHQVHRFLMGLTGVVKLYDSFGYSDSKRLLLIEQSANAYGREFGLQNSQMLRDKIKDDYRKLSPKIISLLEGKLTTPEFDEPLYSSMHKIFMIQEKALIRLSGKLEQVKRGKDIDELIPSYIHMYVNRFFATNQRFEEMMIYQLIEKYYKAKIAREKYNKATHAN